MLITRRRADMNLNKVNILINKFIFKVFSSFFCLEAWNFYFVAYTGLHSDIVAEEEEECNLFAKTFVFIFIVMFSFSFSNEDTFNMNNFVFIF